MLAVAVLGQAASSIAINGPAFLIPTLRSDRGLGLAQAGLVAAMPVAGVTVALVLWGWVVDRVGERLVMLAGLAGTAACTGVAILLEDLVPIAVALFLAGTFAASTSSASGRIVVGWFPQNRRGFAMGIRQMAQPLGVAAAAMSIAVVAHQYGVGAALAIPTGACALAAVAVAVLVVDPPRPARHEVSGRNPYREDFLWRVHGVSLLLVVPQFVVWTYALVWLVDRGWDPAPAGVVVAVSQVCGALGRIVAGALSDAVGSRVRPMLWIALAAGACMVLLGIAEAAGWSVAVVLMVVATTVTVADNGLAFTAVAEHAGPFWSGRALGIQNTAQYVTASATAPIAGLAITHIGYAWTFGLTALGPALALALVPHHDASPPAGSGS